MTHDDTPSIARAMVSALVAALAAGPALTGQANAASVFGSTYSTTEAANCWSADGNKTAAEQRSRICRGIAGLIVSVDVDDLRETVSVGRSRADAAKEPAARAWFGPFNSASRRIEWRMAGSEPFALIQRWQIADPSDEDKAGRPQDTSFLVVTRLPPGPVCHVAYVDAAANPNANELARQAADQTARQFDCSKDQIKIIGSHGRAVDLATRQ